MRALLPTVVFVGAFGLRVEVPRRARREVADDPVAVAGGRARLPAPFLRACRCSGCSTGRRASAFSGGLAGNARQRAVYGAGGALVSSVIVPV